jgi:chromosome partitioning protein
VFHVKPKREPERRNDAKPMRKSVRPPRFQRAYVVTIANQKGGVGKTTTAVSLAAALSDMDCRVLLVDFDPQGNATSGLGLQEEAKAPTIYEALSELVPISDILRLTALPNLVLAPANIDLAGAEIELVAALSRELKLRRVFEPIRGDFDVIVVDCPPSLGLLTVNALCAADGVIVPIQSEYFALEGLGAFRHNAELIRSQLNPRLEILGFVLTMLDARTRLSQQVVAEVRHHFGDRVFKTRIPRTVRLAEAPGFGQPITVFDPTSRGALAYRRLAEEVLDRLVTSHLQTLAAGYTQDVTR